MTEQFRGATRYSRDVCSLMRRINALEQRAVPGNIWPSTYRTSYGRYGAGGYGHLYFDGTNVHAAKIPTPLQNFQHVISVDVFDAAGALVSTSEQPQPYSALGGVVNPSGLRWWHPFWYHNGAYGCVNYHTEYPPISIPSPYGEESRNAWGAVTSTGDVVKLRVNFNAGDGRPWEAVLTFPNGTELTDTDFPLVIDLASAVGVDPDDNVFVINGGRLLKFTIDGEYVDYVDMPAGFFSGAESFSSRLAFTTDGIYALAPLTKVYAEMDQNRLAKFHRSTLQYLFTLRDPLINVGWRTPNMFTFGIAGDQSGNLFNSQAYTSDPEMGDATYTSGIATYADYSDTSFKGYPRSGGSVLLGNDGGYILPDLEALTPAQTNSRVTARLIQDMRDRIEALVPDYLTGAAANPTELAAWALNWTDGDPNNAYYNAVDLADYRVAGGGRGYTWRRSYETMTTGTRYQRRTYDIDIGEVLDLVEYLESCKRKCFTF